MQLQNLVAPLPCDPRPAAALAGDLVASVVNGAALVATTLRAAKEVVFQEVEGSVTALVASASCDSGLAEALTCLGVAGSHAADGSRRVAATVLAAEGIVIAKVPVQILAHVADPPCDTFFALAQFSYWSIAAAGKGFQNTSRVTIAF